MRTRTWKWIEANAGNPRGLAERELFRVETDPLERENVAVREPGLAAEMSRQAVAFEAAARAGKVGEARAASISAEECEQLKQLGYVQDCSGAEAP